MGSKGLKGGNSGAKGRGGASIGKQSQGARTRKKLLAKTSWYKGAGQRKTEYNSGGGNSNNKGATGRESKKYPPRTILFVEQTVMGELGRRLRELMTRLAPILGFRVKIVERTGSSLKSQFPQSSLWDGAPCGRENCKTCTQGAEMLPPCTRKSLVYENVCSICNKGAKDKGELKDVDPLIPSVYVGETSRTVQERAREHWAATRGSSKEVEGSHMVKHMQQYHDGREPEFIMRVVEFHRSALSRQTGEAVRIMRRGGAGSVLNSRAEFNRCYIPRLRVEEQEKLEQMEQWERVETQAVGDNLREQDVRWEKGKSFRKTSKEPLTGRSTKRDSMEQGGARRRKKLKYELLEEDWGAAKTTINEPQLEDNEGAQELLCSTELPTQFEGAMSHIMAVVTTPSRGAVVTIPHIGATEGLETVDLAPTTS